MTDPFDILRRALGVDVAERDLEGTAISADIPLSNELVNRVIRARLAGARGAIAGVRVVAKEDDQFLLEVEVRGPVPIPPITIAARVEEQPEFPGREVLGVRWSMPGLGPLALFAGPALAFFKTLPPGIEVRGDRMWVDIGALARARGLAGLMRYVSKAQLHTRSGAFVVRLELLVRS